jgi:hypothetical protein
MVRHPAHSAALRTPSNDVVRCEVAGCATTAGTGDETTAGTAAGNETATGTEAVIEVENEAATGTGVEAGTEAVIEAVIEVGTETGIGTSGKRNSDPLEIGSLPQSRGADF